MTELVFATHNENKVKEVASVLEQNFTIHSLASLGLHEEIPEPFDTLRANAEEKARVVFRWTGKDCFSEDTGLLTDALNGEPGVRSARYAGDDHNFEANIDKLLANLDGSKNRSAHFLTVICLIYQGNEHIFEGECKGTIIAERRGNKGFGYDSIFMPQGSTKTFGEMELDEKNQYSHRRKAVDKLIAFLKEGRAIYSI